MIDEPTVRSMQEPAGSPSGSRIGAGAAWVGILVVAAVIRFQGLEVRSLWHDEAMSVVFARLAPIDLAERMRIDSTPPLYYLTLGVWTVVFGESVAALRAMSASLGLLLVAGVGFFGARFFGQSVGLAAAFVCAVSPLAVYYSQEARAYALLSVLVLLAWVFLLEDRERGGIGAWLSYSASASAALLTHNYAFFVVGAQCLWVASHRDVRLAARFGGAVALAGLIYLPWVPVLVDQLGNPTPVRWMEDVWNAQGVIGSLRGSLRNLAPGGIYPDPVGSAAVVTTVGILVAGACALWRRRAAAGRASWLLSFTVGPLLLAALYSSIRSNVYLPGRVDQAVLPGFCLLWALGLVSIPVRPLRAAALTVTAGAALLTIAAPRVVERPADDRLLAGTVAARAGSADLVIATSLSRPTLDYYLQERRDLELRSYPAKLDEHLGNRDAAVLLEDPEGLRVDAEGIANRIARGRPAWIAYTPDPVNQFLLEALSGRGDVIVEEQGRFRLTVLGQEVVLLRARGSERPRPRRGKRALRKRSRRRSAVSGS